MISSIFFGATHAIFQQSLIAFSVGMVLAFVAIQSGSILPAIGFHIVHNSLGLLIKHATPYLADENHPLHWLMRDLTAEGQLYHWPVIACSALVGGAILFWFHRMPYQHTAEESLHEAIEHQSARWLPS